MRLDDMTTANRNRLEARMAAARAEREAEAEAARAGGGADAAPEEPDRDTVLWNKGGYFAMLFCLWFVFIAPIVLVLALWD